jgi:glucose/arabinose dehydrogenase
MSVPVRRPAGRLLVALLAGWSVVACGSGTPSSAIAPSPGAGEPSAASAATAVPPTSTPAPSGDGAAVPIVRLDVVAEGLDAPLDVAASEDGTGRLFVAEQGGRIRIVRDGVLLPEPFLDISERLDAGGERGLLGIALHPAFPDDPRVFVDYTDLDGNTVVSSFTVSSSDADAGDPTSERIVLQVEQPYSNHNGGALAFGPDDMLYISLGDGGSGGDPHDNGQRMDTLLGKILRIDVDVAADREPAYGIPADNPYADGRDGARPEIWLSGLRNPWRMRFDPTTGDLWIGDVGQGSWEEVDVARAGVGGTNFGWNRMEGLHCYRADGDCDQTGLTLPVTEYGHDLGASVIGGVVIRDPSRPALDGWYVFADIYSGNLFLLDPVGDEPRDWTIALTSDHGISSIGQDAAGNVYLTDLGSGELLRLEEGG